MNQRNTALLCLIFTTVLFGIPQTFAQQSFTEDFTTTTFKDPAQTTADWNTSLGEIRLFPFEASVVGSVGLPAEGMDLALSGNHAYVANLGFGLQVFDISDPAMMQLVGSHVPTHYAYTVAVDGDRAVVGNSQQGLLVYDVTDPTVPVQVGQYIRGFYVRDLRIAGDRVFVAYADSGLVVVDISDPANPTEIGRRREIGRCVELAFSGDRVFLAAEDSGLVIVNANGSAYNVQGVFETPGPATSVALDGNLAYVAVAQVGLQIVDVSNSATPFLVGSYPLTGATNPTVVVEGDLAFLSATSRGMTILDVIDPSSPQVIEVVAVPLFPKLAKVQGAHAFTLDSDRTLKAVRFADPIIPASWGRESSHEYGWNVVVDGNYAYRNSSSERGAVVDISDPSAPVRVAQLWFNDAFEGSRGIAVSGDWLYQAYYNPGGGLSGIQIFNVYDPTSPIQFTEIPLSFSDGGCRDIHVADNRLFLANGGDGLRVYDVSSPAIPVHLQTLTGSWAAERVVVEGDLAYVVASGLGLMVLDVSNPASGMPIVGQYPYTSAYPPLRGLAIAGNMAYLSTHGLLTVDITDPTNPVLASTTYAGHDATGGLAVSGDRAYVMGNRNFVPSLGVYDISDPTTPVFLGSGPTAGAGYGVAVTGEFAYLANTAGVEAMRVMDFDFEGGTIGQSLKILQDTPTYIVRAKVTPTQTGDVRWSLAFVDPSWHLQDFPGDGSWVVAEEPGQNLFWKSTHVSQRDAVNPTCSSVTVETLLQGAVIDSVEDVPGDQGGRVYLSLARSGYDFEDESNLPVTQYGVYRRVDAATAKAVNDAGTRATDGTTVPGSEIAVPSGENVISLDGATYVVGGSAATAFPEGTWVLVATVPATQSDHYLVEATTVADSSATETSPAVFLVTTHTTTPSFWFTSLPDSGYSIDNIAPAAPAALNAAYHAMSVDLDWDDAPEADFQYYRVYRDTDPGFFPSPSNLIKETTLSSWSDPGADPWNQHFKVSTLDHAGNESEAASPSGVTGVPDGTVPTRTALLGAVPNPFNPMTKLSFKLAASGHSRLKVYDTAGRLVTTLINERRDAGWHEVIWDGRDHAGRISAAGVYLYRLEVDDYVEAKRMTLVK